MKYTLQCTLAILLLTGCSHLHREICYEEVLNTEECFGVFNCKLQVDADGLYTGVIRFPCKTVIDWWWEKDNQDKER